MEPATDWPEVRRRLSLARRRLKLSGRAAADSAGINEATWRFIEKGERNVGAGQKVPYYPSPETLERCAWAVEEEPSELFALVNWLYAGPLSERLGGAEPDPWQVAFEARMARIEQLVEQLLERLGVRA